MARNTSDRGAGLGSAVPRVGAGTGRPRHWMSCLEPFGAVALVAVASLAASPGCGNSGAPTAGLESRGVDLVSAPQLGVDDAPPPAEGDAAAAPVPADDSPHLAPVSARFIPPLPAEVADDAGIVINRDWAVVLGKALFWDQRVGSDGQACASCHFHAGADPRITGQLNPGFLDRGGEPGGDQAFGSTRSDTGSVERGQMPGGAAAGTETRLVAADFPLHRLQDETNRDSPVRTDTNDVVGSVGAFAAVFSGIEADGTERCASVDAHIFHVSDAEGRSLAARQVEPRNTPTTINAAFNMRQFWDGRANNTFNGVGVFGLRDIEGDPNLRLIVLDDAGTPQLDFLQLANASLASQSVGPPLNAIEMSCAGRSFADLGRKILRGAPLALQHVDPNDSVLGALAHPTGAGLEAKYSYASLIQRAFAPRYWSAPGKYRRTAGALVEDENGFTQMETNMSMFWGLSIMLYEATLISDQSEFDDLLASGDITFPNCTTSAAVDPLLARGCKIFFRAPFGPAPADGVRGAGCAFCHAGRDTFSEGAVQAGVGFVPLLQVTDVNGVIGTRDLGFANLGTRPTSMDVSLGGLDPYGNPLSFGRQYRQYVETGDRSVVKDPLLLRAIDNNTLVRGGAANPDAKLESDGAIKIPGVRNSALTPPYFSYGGYASLREVMKFYNRGGNRRQISADNAQLEAPGSLCVSGDNTGTGADGNHALPVAAANCNTNVTGLMTPLGLLDCDANGEVTCDVATDDLSAVVRFMESLTDRRVQCDEAPFDHPELSVTHGQAARESERPGAAVDERFLLPAAGASGYDASSGLCIPNVGNLFAPGMQGRVGGERVPLE
jgi:cytochrome c peroxidase